VIDLYILCYRRKSALEACLSSIKNFSSDTLLGSLYLYQDGGAEPFSVIAEKYSKQFGKEVIHCQASVNLGIKNNMQRIFTDALARKRDIIVLEEDCVCSPSLIQYCNRMLKIKTKYRLAQYSLYNFEYNELAHCNTFLPQSSILPSDFFVLQQCSSWGFFMTLNQIAEFEAAGGFCNRRLDILPRQIQLWPDATWKKYFISYLLETNKWTLAPRTSLCSTQGVAGKNSKIAPEYSVSQLVHGPQPAAEREPSFDNYHHLLELNCYLEIRNPEAFASNATEAEILKTVDMDLYGLREDFARSRRLTRALSDKETHLLLVTSVRHWMGDQSYNLDSSQPARKRLWVRNLSNSNSHLRRFSKRRTFALLLYNFWARIFAK